MSERKIHPEAEADDYSVQIFVCWWGPGQRQWAWAGAVPRRIVSAVSVHSYSQHCVLSPLKHAVLLHVYWGLARGSPIFKGSAAHFCCNLEVCPPHSTTGVVSKVDNERMSVIKHHPYFYK